MHLEAPALARLHEHDWPGNVRELRNVLERALVLAEDGRIRRGDIVL
jgi:transcriptional regulator of acetoin/glycerol metabolism